MTALLTPVHQAILTRLYNVLTPKGAYLFDGKVPDGAEIPMIPAPAGGNGAVAPHVVLWFGDDDEMPGTGSVGEPHRDSVGALSFVLLLVASDNLSLTVLRDLVKPALIGVVVPGGGQIRSEGGVVEQPVPVSSNPQRYMRTIEFAVSVGLAGVA